MIREPVTVDRQDLLPLTCAGCGQQITGETALKAVYTDNTYYYYCNDECYAMATVAA